MKGEKSRVVETDGSGPRIVGEVGQRNRIYIPARGAQRPSIRVAAHADAGGSSPWQMSVKLNPPQIESLYAGTFTTSSFQRVCRTAPGRVAASCIESRRLIEVDPRDQGFKVHAGQGPLLDDFLDAAKTV